MEGGTTSPSRAPPTASAGEWRRGRLGPRIGWRRRSDRAPPAGGSASALLGTNGPDTLTGGDAGEVVIGFGSGDRMRGEGGHDCLVGGPGADRLTGGEGDDRLVGGAAATICAAARARTPTTPAVGTT